MASNNLGCLRLIHFHVSSCHCMNRQRRHYNNKIYDPCYLLNLKTAQTIGLMSLKKISPDKITTAAAEATTIIYNLNLFHLKYILLFQYSLPFW